jgi:hypothetical protein
VRKAYLSLGLGLLFLGGILFYAEQKRADSQDHAALEAIEDVLKAQNQALAGRIFAGLTRADIDANTLYSRWAKKPKAKSYFGDTSLAEPDAPKWSIVAGRRVRAAGVIDDALLEDALDVHQTARDRLSLYSAKGKTYLFINGVVDGQPYASAYVPEAFFSNFRSSDGIRAWLALRDGTVIYHPISRFIGANAANMKPVAAGIQELTQNSSSPYTRRYLGLEGHDALGAWTPLPSYGLLVASEWPKVPDSAASFSALFWFALITGGGGFFLIGAALLGKNTTTTQIVHVAEERGFSEDELSDEAMDYLEQVKATADRAMAAADSSQREAEEANRERNDALDSVGTLEWKARVYEDYLDRVITKTTVKQVWDTFGALLAHHSPEISAVVYRYSPSSFSLTPEGVYSKADLPEEATTFLQDARIFLGNLALLESLPATEAFQRWNKNRERHMPNHQTDFRVYPFTGLVNANGTVTQGKGAFVLFFDRRLNAGEELEGALKTFDTLIRRTATFCDTLQPLLHSKDAKGSARPAVASSSNDSRNRPRPS